MREIRSLTAASSEEYFNAAFVRTAAAKEPIRLHGPESFLMTYSASSGLGASLVVARVDTTGKTLWRADTGIGVVQLPRMRGGVTSKASV